MAHHGALGDTSEHKGALFWLVTRTDVPEQANLDFEYVTWEQKVQVHLPGPKKRKVGPVEWVHSELPSFPVLVTRRPWRSTRNLLCSWPRRKTRSRQSLATRSEFLVKELLMT